jgi:arginyl-tRNA synthetase
MSIIASEIKDIHHIMENAKISIADSVIQSIQKAYGVDVSSMHADICSKLVAPTIKGRGELSLPCFIFAKHIQGPPVQTAQKIHAELTSLIADVQAAADSTSSIRHIAKSEAAGPYLNFWMTSSFLASVIPLVLSGDYVRALPAEKDRVMIEYSQPNVLKSFHVGHMRNAALGDCLVRLYEHMGHPVIAANYYGDEGAHVAKCLWAVRQYMSSHPEFDIDSIPVPERGEWLGDLYTKAVEMLDLGALTSLPYPNTIAAKVLDIQPHPATDAPSNWKVVNIQFGPNDDQTTTVVCGGMGYSIGDLVAYTPVGTKIKGKTVDVKDMKGVASAGIMMAEKELGIERKEEKKVEEKKDKKEEKKGGKGGKKSEKGDKVAAVATATDSAANQIYVLPPNTPVGVELVEHGRLPNVDIPTSVRVIDEFEKRKSETRELLLQLEHKNDPTINGLFDKTRQWSLDEFARIYQWLDCRFDHNFYESEEGEVSRLLANEYYKRGVFINSNGAVGADLNSYGLGFCMVLKSDGTGLYATKDLSLAQRKFETFHIERSIYIVDAAQSLHFKQVFKTLELMGYEQAKKCIHIPYGQVVLPSGKMSSRVGNVILFSQLKSQLDQDIYANFLKKYDPSSPQEIETIDATTQVGEYKKTERNTDKWTTEEIEAARHAIAVATIKYGMLNHDTMKDIVFVLSEWSAKSGNTGPYMLYAYARIRSIIREVNASSDLSLEERKQFVDFTVLQHDLERNALSILHEFWTIVEQCTSRNNPSSLCDYLFELSKAFSAWYEKCSIMKAESDKLKWTRLQFIEAIGEVLRTGLQLLGIKTLERM